jgi:arylsulfatase A-like enzyme
MKKFLGKFICVLNTTSFLSILFIFNSCSSNKIEKNVLFINVDDLRPQLGCYEESLPLNGQELIKTPNIDKLAEEGTLFERAYCAVAVCGASRLSFLTGSRPYKEPNQSWGRHWAYYSRLDEEERNEPAGLNHPGNSVTMPQHFKNNGYKTLSIGKVYHPMQNHHLLYHDRPYQLIMFYNHYS